MPPLPVVVVVAVVLVTVESSSIKLLLDDEAIERSDDDGFVEDAVEVGGARVSISTCDPFMPPFT